MKIFQPGPYVNVFIENSGELPGYAFSANADGDVAGFRQRQIIPAIIKSMS